MSLKIEEYPLIQTYDNVFDREYCDLLIEMFHNKKDFQQKGQLGGFGDTIYEDEKIKKTTDVFLKHFLDDMNQRQLENSILRCVDNYCQDKEVLYNYFALNGEMNYKVTEFIMMKYEQGEGEFRTHCDWNANPYGASGTSLRTLSVCIYLNDVNVGGELKFKHLGFSIKPKAGRIVLFPPYWTHQHKGAVPISGDKYVISTWIRFKFEIFNTKTNSILIDD